MLDGGAQADPAASPASARRGLLARAGVADLSAAIQENWTDGQPVVPLIFYRALVQGAGLNPINRLVRVSLARRGSTRCRSSWPRSRIRSRAATLDQLFTAAPPAVILNCTSFAVGSPPCLEAAKPLTTRSTAPSANGAPVFQVVLAGSSEAAWDRAASPASPPATSP